MDALAADFSWVHQLCLHYHHLGGGVLAALFPKCADVFDSGLTDFIRALFVSPCSAWVVGIYSG